MRKILHEFIAVYAIIITWLFCYQWQESRMKDYALRDYAIVNNKYLPLGSLEKETGRIKYYASRKHIPASLIMAIGDHENGLGTHTFGCKRIPWHIAWFKPIDEWQMLTCMEIVKEEMYDYAEVNNKYFKNDEELCQWIERNGKHFVRYLAKRYNHKDQKNWAYWVNRHWKKYQNGG